ncbi:MAG: glycerate kinase [Planctomycetota bacterium]|nr:MAG: glycerate kinase [Planctomycetota bacterium]
MTERPLRVLVAPDSFKGTFSSVIVAGALADGWNTIRAADAVSLMPLADGGEGTLDAVEASGGWDRHPVAAKDPLMRTLAASFLRDDECAVVEMAAASGLSRLSAGECDAMAATAFGTGQILATAIGLGCHHIVIGLGGSATTDGGAGLLEALGARFRDAGGTDLAPGGGALGGLASIDLDGLSEVLSEVHLTVASDVTNPLLGERGAAATYGPQKGATPEQVAELDRNLRRYADVMEGAIGRPLRYEAGTGAAGGATFGLLAIADRFASLEVRPGVDVVMELTGFDDAVAAADLVLTGEGMVDGQTAYGKTAMGVAERARAAGVPTICFGGGVTPDGAEFMHSIGVITMPVTERPMDLEEVVAAGTAPIARAASRAAAIVDLAGGLGR